jgi:hypothetical protein
MAIFPKVHCASGSLLTASVNANVNTGANHIVPPSADRSITVLDCWMRATGGAATGATAIVLEDTGGTDVVSNAVAGLTQNTILRAGATHSTASGLGTTLTKGRGLRIINTVAPLETATSIEYEVLYTVTM